MAGNKSSAQSLINMIEEWVLDYVKSYPEIKQYEKEFLQAMIKRSYDIIDETKEECIRNKITSSKDPLFSIVYQQIIDKYPTISEIADTILEKSYKKNAN